MGVRGLVPSQPSSHQPRTPEPTRTCLTALGDESAQGLAHRDPQVWALADGCAQCPRQPFKGGSYICGPRAEPRQEGPDLGREGMVNKNDIQQPTPLHYPTHTPLTDPLPATAACHRSWTPPCGPPGPGPLLECNKAHSVTLGTLLPTRPHFHQNQKPSDEVNISDSFLPTE